MKERVFSGVQPSGVLHIGNYLGAIKNWVSLQKDYQCIFCVVDLHALTIPQEAAQLRKKTIEVAKIYLAAGIDPQKSNLFIQSHVKEHAELCWLLNTIARISELFKMTQFKDKAKIDFEKINEEIRRRIIYNTETHIVSSEIIKSIEELLVGFRKSDVGLFDYPVLMAADILLYQTAVVPVGHDQLQHIELTCDLAQRFNNKFGEVFTIPKPLIKKEGARIMGLDDPSKKMSKSAPSVYNYIALTDSPDEVREKIKKAVTDSGKEIKYKPAKPELSNLLMIYSLLADKPVAEVERGFDGKSYIEFKNELAEIIIGFLDPFQKKYNALKDDDVLGILRDGAKKIQPIAAQTMKEVKKAMGIIE